MVPMRPADMPPVPPQVTYRDGMLTVHAMNSTMNSLLMAIRNKTGIQFEGAENASERVAISVGPAPEGEVLAGIFSGSGFSYVVLGREDSPGTVQRVILTPKRGAGATAFAGPPPQQAQPAQQAQPPQQQAVDEEAAPDEEATDDAGNPYSDQPQDTAVQPPPTSQVPMTQQEPQTGGPKTPEQLLEELKRMQQQQQGVQPNPNSVPRKPPR